MCVFHLYINIFKNNGVNQYVLIYVAVTTPD